MKMGLVHWLVSLLSNEIASCGRDVTSDFKQIGNEFVFTQGARAMKADAAATRTKPPAQRGFLLAAVSQWVALTHRLRSGFL